MKRNICIIFIILCGILIGHGMVSASEDGALYRDAIRQLKAGKRTFAFLKFKRLVQFFPDSEFAEESQWQVIQQYLKEGATRELNEELERYYRMYPNGRFIEEASEITRSFERQELIKVSENFRRKKEWKKCIDSYSKILKDDSNNSDLQIKLRECEDAYAQERLSQEILIKEKKDTEEKIVKETAESLGMTVEELTKHYNGYWE